MGEGEQKKRKSEREGDFLEEERKWGEERKQKKEEKRENLNNGGLTQRDAR